MSGITNEGIVPKTQEDMLADLGAYGRASIDAAMVLPAEMPTSKWGLIAGAIAKGLAECWLVLSQVPRMLDPANAVGEMADGIGALRGRPRLAPTNAEFTASVDNAIDSSLAPGTVFVKQDGTTGPIYTNKSRIYPITGSGLPPTLVDVQFICVTAGVIVPPANGATLVFVTPVANIGPTLTLNPYTQINGRTTESDADYMVRQSISIGNSASAKVENMMNALIAQDPDAYVNTTNTVGVCSLYVGTGLSDVIVARTVLDHLGAGVSTAGTTTVQVPIRFVGGQLPTADVYGVYIPVSFTRIGTYVTNFDCTIVASSGMTATQKSDVLVAATNGLDKYLNSIMPGGTVYKSKVQSVVESLPNVVAISSSTLTVNGATITTSTTLAAGYRPAIGTVTITWT